MAAACAKRETRNRKVEPVCRRACGDGRHRLHRLRVPEHRNFGRASWEASMGSRDVVRRAATAYRRSGVLVRHSGSGAGALASGFQGALAETGRIAQRRGGWASRRASGNRAPRVLLGGTIPAPVVSFTAPFYYRWRKVRAPPVGASQKSGPQFQLDLVCRRRGVVPERRARHAPWKPALGAGECGDLCGVSGGGNPAGAIDAAAAPGTEQPAVMRPSRAGLKNQIPL